jgi:hypothetical protein
LLAHGYECLGTWPSGWRPSRMGRYHLVFIVGMRRLKCDHVVSLKISFIEFPSVMGLAGYTRGRLLVVPRLPKAQTCLCFRIDLWWWPMFIIPNSWIVSCTHPRYRLGPYLNYYFSRFPLKSSEVTRWI